METRSFSEYLLQREALKLRNEKEPTGLFTLKSGRKSPFFVNMGFLNSGEDLNELGRAYATAAYEQWGRGVDIFFGPAYKGIALAVAATMWYNTLYRGEASYSADRKEAKDHGDIGGFVGATPYDGARIVITEDVTTSGKSISEVVPKIRAAAPSVELLGLIVSVNRMECGKLVDKTALEEIAEEYHIKTIAITSIADVLKDTALPEEELEKFREYYAKYGVAGRDVVP